MALVYGTNCGFCASAPSEDPAASTTGLDNAAFVMYDISPANAVTITEVGWWCDNATEESNFEVGLYDSDGAVVPGEAGTRLYVADTNAKGLDAGWKKKTGLNWAISGSHSYWIAVQLDNTDTQTLTNYASSGGLGFDTKGSQTSLPTPFDGGGIYDTDGKCAFYAVYVTGGVALSINVNDDAP